MLTLIIFGLALSPQGAGLLVPVSQLGFSLALQLVPAALGILYLRRITPHGAFAGMLSGTTAMVVTALLGGDLVFGPGVNGLVVNALVTAVVSGFTEPVHPDSQRAYRALYRRYYAEEAPVQRTRRTEEPV